MLRSLFSAFVIAVSVVGCKVDVPATIIVSPNQSFLSCSATPLVSPVASGAPATIRVQAQGGVAPYTVAGSTAEFGANTQIVRSYTNTGTSAIVVTDFVTVNDSAGNSNSCMLLVNVSGTSTNPSNLACTVDVSPSSTVPNTNLGVLVTMSGGTGVRSVLSSDFGNGAILVQGFSVISPSTTAQAVVKYSSTGTKTVSIQVKDGVDNVTSCSKSFSVNPTATVSVVATPSATVLAGSTITLQASSTGFTSNLTYNFTTANSNVTIVKSGNMASITNNDLNARNFNVLVTATDGAQTATVTASLSFTANLSMNCNLTHPAGNYKVGDQVTFTVAATNAASLWVTEFWVQDAVVVGSVGTSTTVRFTASGTKIAKVKAQTNSGQLCNNGAYVEDSVVITNPTPTTYTCSVATAPNPSRTSEYFLAQVTSNLPYAAYAVVESIDSNVSIPYGYSTWQESGKNAYVWIGIPGTYQLTFTVYDQYSGNRATCSTQHAVWY